MVFNLNEFLTAISFTLDFIEMDILGVASNHSKRVAYISYRIGERLGLGKEKLFDLVSLSLLHDNGASEKVLHDKLVKRDKSALHSIESLQEHGIIGEKNIVSYPFLTSIENVIKYHHENYDGSGFFRQQGESIPLFSQIIRLADVIELNHSLKDIDSEGRLILSNYVKEQEAKLFSPTAVNAYFEASQKPSFWMDLKDAYINTALKRAIPQFGKDLSFKEIHNITMVFSKIIDSKSQFTQIHSRELSQKAKIMSEYYNKPADEMYMLMIAADLHDIGKLAVSNDILDKPDMLDKEEFDSVIAHPYYTRISLQEISGFEEITEWASNHHEKLNGSGYPFKKSGSELDFNSRLMACLDIYQALTEERPYRPAMRHAKAFSILAKLASEGTLDSGIVHDIDIVFGR